MARIPQPHAADFQLRDVPMIAAPRGIDVAPLQQLGRVLIDRGLTQAAADARRDGMLAQAQAADGALVKRDSGFFGFFDKAFDEGARYYFTRQKQIQVDDVVNQVAAEHPDDPAGFREALELRRDEIFAGVAADVLPGIQLYFNQRRAGVDRRLVTAAAEAENRKAKSQFLVDYGELVKEGALEVERDGSLTPETEARFQRMREQAGVMDFLPEQRAALEVTARDQLDISNLYHQFVNLGTLQERTAFFDSLLRDDGPLKDRPFFERGQIVNQIATLQQANRSAVAASKRALFRRADDGIEIMKGGADFADMEAVQAGLLALAATDDAAYDKLQAFTGALVRRDKAQQAYRMPMRMLRSQIRDGEARARRDGGGFATVAELHELDAYRQALVAQEKAWATGEFLDLVEDHEIDFSKQGYDQMPRRQRVEFLEQHYAHRVRLEDGREVVMRLAPVLWYTRPEMQDFVNQWRGGDAGDRMRVLNTIAMEVPRERVGAVVQQLSKAAPAMAGVVSLFASDRQERQLLGQSVMQGRAFLESQDDLDKVFRGVETTFFTKFRARLPHDATGDTIRAYTDMAVWRYADLARIDQSFDGPSQEQIKSIMQELAGGEFWTMPNGEVAFPMGPGLDATQSKDLWNGLDDDFLRSQLGGELPVDNTDPERMTEYDAERIREDGFLVPTRDGRFNVRLPAAPGGSVLGEETITLKDRRTDRNYELDPARLQARPGLRFGGAAFGGDVLAP